MILTWRIYISKNGLLIIYVLLIFCEGISVIFSEEEMFKEFLTISVESWLVIILVEFICFCVLYIVELLISFVLMFDSDIYSV